MSNGAVWEIKVGSEHVLRSSRPDGCSDFNFVNALTTFPKLL
jgi:hypothetical protein